MSTEAKSPLAEKADFLSLVTGCCYSRRVALPLPEDVPCVCSQHRGKEGKDGESRKAADRSGSNDRGLNGDTRTNGAKGATRAAK